MSIARSRRAELELLRLDTHPITRHSEARPPCTWPRRHTVDCRTSRDSSTGSKMPANRTLILSALLFLLSAPLVRAGDAAPSYIDLADAPTVGVDWSKGDVQALTLHGNRTLTFSGGQKGGKYLLILKQDATGSRAVAWPSSLRWPGGPPQTKGVPANILTTTANRKDFLTFFFDGVNYDVLAMAQDY